MLRLLHVSVFALGWTTISLSSHAHNLQLQTFGGFGQTLMLCRCELPLVTNTSPPSSYGIHLCHDLKSYHWLFSTLKGPALTLKSNYLQPCGTDNKDRSLTLAHPSFCWESHHLYLPRGWLLWQTGSILPHREGSTYMLWIFHGLLSSSFSIILSSPFFGQILGFYPDDGSSRLFRNFGNYLLYFFPHSFSLWLLWYEQKFLRQPSYKKMA